MDRLARFVATVGGVGRLPVAPGTWGSLIGLAAAWWLAPPSGAVWTWWPTPWRRGAWLVVASVVGAIAAGRVARDRREVDPSVVVCDEFVGMLWSLWGWPRAAGWWLAAFALFRCLDITKPWPIRACERLPGGWGIMADDVAAGLLTNGCLRLALLALLALAGPTG